MASPAEALFAPIRAAAGRSGLTDFLRWWVGELVSMVPAVWRERFTSRRIAYVVADGDDWRAFRLAGGKLVEAGRASLGGMDTAARRAAFRRLVSEGGADAANVWLVLAPESVLVRSVTLPLAAEEALGDAIGFELDRLTPFSAEHACFGYRVAGRDTAAQALTIELAVAPLAAVTARLVELREVGATVLGVGVASDIAVASSPLNLLAPEARERPTTSRSTILARVLAAVAALFALVALLYPLLQKREAVIALQPRLDKAKAGADVADRLAKEIEKLASEHNFLLAKKQGQYPVVTLVEDLSRLLPDTTWIQQLDIKSGPKVRELQIAGETGSSSQLIEVLEKSGTLANASFKSPLTKGATPGTERFLLAAEVKPRPIPEPMPETALASAPAPAPTSTAGSSPSATAPATATTATTTPATAPVSQSPAAMPTVPQVPATVSAPARTDGPPPKPASAPAAAPGAATPPAEATQPPSSPAKPAGKG